VRIGRNQAGELEIGFTGSCAGCRESYPDMQHTIQIIAQKTSLTIPEATAFYLGFTIGVDSVRRYQSARRLPGRRRDPGRFLRREGGGGSVFTRQQRCGSSLRFSSWTRTLTVAFPTGSS